MADLRHRHPAPPSPPPDPPAKAAAAPPPASPDLARTRFSVLDVLRILAGLALLSAALSYYVTGSSFVWSYSPWFADHRQLSAWLQGPLRLTDAQLLAYDGTDPRKPIYLALNGTIYDVTAGRHAYGPGGSYHALAGRDAARAFVTGCFAEDLTADLRGVEEVYVPLDGAGGEVGEAERETEREVARGKVREGIEGWESLFKGETGKEYFPVGEVRREQGWLEKLPRRGLCEAAQKRRKVRK